MALPEVLNTNISVYLQNKDILEKLVKQIKKDLNMYGVEFNYSDQSEMVYTEMHQILTKNIQTLVTENNKNLLSILYRIDISEKELSLAGLELPDYNYVEIIAHLIIKRELQKVLFKEYYATK